MKIEESDPDKRSPEGPVGWLLGPQLIASLKWMLLYTAFGTKLDARDWMQAQPFPSGSKIEAENEWRDRNKPNERDLARERAEGWKFPTKDTRDFWEQKGEFWFDYIADTGDGQKATYSIAYLCLNTLWAKALWQAKPPQADSDLLLDCRVKPEETELVPLPRGEFLFVGGDTTYHMADYASLHTRFQIPFTWAFGDFKKDMSGAGRQFDETRRPLFGIPGNHDYYDMLDGFRRQFRRPVNTEDKHYHTDDKTAPQLMIDGYERRQQSSYVALRLPFDWWFWGLDTEVGEIDERQKQFFKAQHGNRMPDKLIVATCSPTTVFGQYAAEDDEKASQAFLQLGLPRLFLPDLEKSRMAEGEGARALPPHQLRLDISGDVHHYARYWGPATPAESLDKETPPRQERDEIIAPGPALRNYASVVSGLGGAFHHPSTTYKNEVREQVLYPPETESRSAVAKRIFNPNQVRHGGYVWLIGGLMAFLLYLILATVPSARQSINSFSPLVALGITEVETVKPTVGDLSGKPHTGYYTGMNALETPWSYRAGVALAVLTLPLIIVTFAWCETRHARLKKQQKRDKRPRLFIGEFNKIIYPLATLIILTIAGALLLLRHHRPHMTPFANSMMVLLSFIWGLSALALSFRYSDWLFEHAANAVGDVNRWPARVFMALGGVAPVLGLWLFGRNNQPAYLFTDILFILIVALVALLLIYAAAFMGGHMLGWKGRLLMGAGGAWHALLQIVFPILLVRRGTWLTVLLAGLAILLFMRRGKKVMCKGGAGSLAVLGFFYGLVMLLLPFAVIFLLTWLNLSPKLSFLYWPQAPVTELTGNWFASYEWWALKRNKGSLSTLVQSYGWWIALIPATLAGLVGALMSCVWFGWYLAISLAFNGHNNEAGGAARIEDYKQFVRVRLTKNSLTAYVIAVDKPEIKGSRLRPKLIDVFTLSRDDKEEWPRLPRS
ncbi:MAG TPA: hypothetical protein VJS44_03405 [Pyrinomonadaceae bacterium]|nr:hypothetical protein [Pyrinomonadaceae bacterium]